jgi:hypothetical protein
MHLLKSGDSDRGMVTAPQWNQARLYACSDTHFV